MENVCLFVLLYDYLIILSIHQLYKMFRLVNLICNYISIRVCELHHFHDIWPIDIYTKHLIAISVWVSLSSIFLYPVHFIHVVILRCFFLLIE